MAELRKPLDEQHPVIQWHQALADLQNANLRSDHAIAEMPANGVARAFLGLAYDLYTIEHNTDCKPHDELWEEQLHRLRHAKEFVGARYEVRIAAMLIRAGFKLVWIGRTGVKSCEFDATFPDTGAKFAVECKIRQALTTKKNPRVGKFVSLVVDALDKQTDLQRWVFVDLNIPASRRFDPDSSSFRDAAVARLRLLEGSPIGRTLPSALVMITNFPDHHHLDSLVPDAGGVLEGFKMPDYRFAAQTTVAEAVARRRRQQEVEAFRRSMEAHSHSPSSFDGSIFGVDDNPARLRIGGRYEFEAGVIGQVEDACLDEASGEAWVVANCGSLGRRVIKVPLTKIEVEAWKQYPETFLGVLRPPDGRSHGPMDLYDFFLSSLQDQPRSSLIDQLGMRFDLATMGNLTHKDLAELRALQLTEGALHMSGGFPTPNWAKRLRPPAAEPTRSGSADHVVPTPSLD